MEENGWIGRCSSKEVEVATWALCSTSPKVKDQVVEALAKSAASLHPLKRERMELSALLKDFYVDAYREQRSGLEHLACPIFFYSL
jgi:hypothetical protein